MGAVLKLGIAGEHKMLKILVLISVTGTSYISALHIAHGFGHGVHHGHIGEGCVQHYGYYGKRDAETVGSLSMKQRSVGNGYQIVTRNKRKKRSPEERDPSEHLANDGTHLWNLGDYHESEKRKKRSSEERDPSEHLAIDGTHLWNLGDYHESEKRKKRSPEERDPSEHLANDGTHFWNLGDYH